MVERRNVDDLARHLARVELPENVEPFEPLHLDAVLSLRRLGRLLLGLDEKERNPGAVAPRKVRES
jgi:hypothetical protein